MDIGHHRVHKSTSILGELHRAGMQSPISFLGTAEQPLEGLSEIRAPAVDDRVEGRVSISQPIEEKEELVRHQVPVENVHYVHQEEGQPAECEGAHYDA